MYQKYQKKYELKNPEYKKLKNLRYRLRKGQQGVNKEEYVEIVSKFLDNKYREGIKKQN